MNQLELAEPSRVIKCKYEVPDYCSSESEQENHEEPKSKRVRGCNKLWVFHDKFSELKEAEDFVNAETTWARTFTRMTDDGQKRFYRCNKVRKNGPQCAAELYMLFESGSDSVFVYRTEADHNHNDIGTRTRNDQRITDETKVEINKLFDQHLKPKAILAALKKIDGIKLPTKNQLNNYLSQRRRFKVEKPTIQLSEFYDEDDGVPECCSSESEQENHRESKPKRARGCNKLWVFHYKFPNIKEAEDLVNAENTWSRTFTRMTDDGQKRFYRCNKVRKKGPQCAAELYLLFESGSDSVFVYRTEADHNHNDIGTRDDYGITDETKIEINKLFDLHLKPIAILAALKKIDGIKVPTKMQLNNYLSQRRRFKFGNREEVHEQQNFPENEDDK